MQNENIDLTGLGRALQSSKLVRVSEIVVVFLVALSVIAATAAVIDDNFVAYVGGIWAANILMIAIVYLGLRLRRQNWTHFGLSLRLGGWRSVIRAVGQSLLVFLAAMSAFVVGAVLMANIVGMPAGADMTRYEYLRGNIPMTVLALMSVYIVSAFAEEVIYRAFLINRIAELGSGKAAWWLAVVVSSLAFGLVHSDWGLAGMVQTSFMGLALGVSYLVVGRNLWVPILAHGYMDTILILQMYFAT